MHFPVCHDLTDKKSLYVRQSVRRSLCIVGEVLIPYKMRKRNNNAIYSRLFGHVSVRQNAWSELYACPTGAAGEFDGQFRPIPWPIEPLRYSTAYLREMN
jgi:hypothetical protein